MPTKKTACNGDVTLLSNNEVILQSEGGGGQKRLKIAVILDVWPLRGHLLMNNVRTRGGV